MSRLHVKPRIPGAIIRDPHTKRALPDEGGRVPDTSFWRRRLAYGDVVQVHVVRVEQADVDALADIKDELNKHNNIAGPAPSAPSPAMKGE
jgi:hypothetical protein